MADDVIAAPRATVSELRYPASAFTVAIEPASTVLAPAGSGTLSTWQGERLAG